MTEQNVILVNENDIAMGAIEKLAAHQQGLLHRAFSVFIFDGEGKMLLQQRASQKYHGANLWSNTCCSHPYPGEDVKNAAIRRLKEEMGFETPLKKIFHFIYKTEVENNLVEHEFDHVFAGEYEGMINANAEEVKDHCFKKMEAVKFELEENPEKFTTWFRIAFPKIETWWKEHYLQQVVNVK